MKLVEQVNEALNLKKAIGDISNLIKAIFTRSKGNEQKLSIIMQNKTTEELSKIRDFILTIKEDDLSDSHRMIRMVINDVLKTRK